MSKKKQGKSWLSLIMKKDVSETDGGEEGSGEATQAEESYATILQSLGVDTKDMSLEDIQNMIHEFSQEGRLKGAKIIDFQSGKVKKTYKSKKESGRTFKVMRDDKVPMSPEEITEQEYKKSSEKKDENKPKGPPLGPAPTPKGPGR